ncbi:MAG: SusC/RagA family TonB-linked outer membrane protein [Cytophagales bacterium]|nr:SusC/RagA family TonB-linked outer membrane protein [Cytophagales bacterium]
MSKYVGYGFIIQCMLFTIILASDGFGQANRLHDIQVSFDLDNASIEEAFKEIESQTSFKFAYKKSAIKKNVKINNEYRDEPLDELLLSLAQEGKISFKRVNHTIYVAKAGSEGVQLTIPEESFLQERTITGNVTSSDEGGMPGVNVVVKGTSIGSITDINGAYSINVPENAILVFSSVGYLTEEVEVGNQSIIDVVLEVDITALDEIVVVGYGTQKKENLTGAISTVNANLIENRPITSVSTALQGTTTGVFINQNSGQPGRDDVLIRIRGVGTLNDANPLILVDGIEAPMDNINPQDIETITVLKDAASSAIYGSRAANGVVLITTKRGARNKKPTFIYDGYVGVSDATLLPDMVTDAVRFAELRNESLTNFGSPVYFSDEQIEGFRQNREKISTDWLDLIFDPAPIQQHTLGVSGGSENTNYRLSFGYLDQEGVMISSDFKRLNTRLNLDSKVSEKFKLGTSISLTRGDRNSPYDDLSSLSSLFTHAIQALPTSPPYDDQGRYAAQNPEFGNNSRGNPLPEAEAFSFNSLTYEILGNAYLEYEPVQGLVFNGTLGVNYRNRNNKEFNAQVSLYDWVTGEERIMNPVRRSSRYNWEGLNTTVWLTGTYEKRFNDHGLKVLAGFNQEEHNSSWFSAARQGHLSNSVQVLDVGLASTATNSGSETTWALRSYFGRINYDYKDRYLFEANVRLDGSSRFSKDKWGTFPSFSAGWIISNENFFAGVNAIDFLKLRASWGQLGNQNTEDIAGNFPYARTLSLNQPYNFGGTVVSGVAQTSLGNEDLTWETSTMTDIGIDLGIFNNLSIEADYYIRTTEDTLFDVPISALTGYTEQITNASTVENRGWELLVNYDQTIGEFKFSVGGNVSHVTNEVKTLNPNIPSGEVDRLITGRRILTPGAPINSFYGLKAIGIFQSQEEIDDPNTPDHSTLDPNFGPGDLRFADADGDGDIDADDRVVLGQENPVWTYGITFSLEWKGFDLAGIFQGAADFHAYGSEELSDPFFNNAGLPARWEDRWTPGNPGASMPRLYFSTGPSNKMANSFFVYDRSYFRLKNLQLGYNFNVDNIFFSRARVYLNGSNLFTVTDFPYFDPERPAGADRGATGFPNIRIISIGANLRF